MGYFSEQSILMDAESQDCSYHSFDTQLLWRLDDLNDRYTELVIQDAPCYGEDHYTADDYRYAPIECFETLYDISRAIEIAKADLLCRSEASISDGGCASDEILEDTTEPLQLKLFDDTCPYIDPLPRLAA